MTGAGGADPVEVLYEDAPCGLLSLSPDGDALTVNRTRSDRRSTQFKADIAVLLNADSRT